MRLMTDRYTTRRTKRTIVVFDVHRSTVSATDIQTIRNVMQNKGDAKEKRSTPSKNNYTYKYYIYIYLTKKIRQREIVFHGNISTGWT